jgi:hypothetical protein
VVFTGVSAVFVYKTHIFSPYSFFARVGLKGLIEWHPFTLSSSPEEQEITVHIRAYGA